MADSSKQLTGGLDRPGLGRHGSTPDAVISSVWRSCQLSLNAMTVCPENNRKVGSGRVPGTKNGAPDIDGSRALSKTVLGALPSMTNPPIITLSPVSTRARVDMLTS